MRPLRKPQHDYFLPDLCAGPAVLWLVLGGALLALVLSLARQGLPTFPWRDFALTLLAVEWTVLLTAGLLCRLRHGLAQRPLVLGALMTLGLAVAVASGVSLAGQALLATVQVSQGEVPFWWQVLTHGLLAGLLVGMLLRYFYLTHQLRRREQAALAAQVEALTARIRPHFLFNSLNSIASLVGEQASTAETAVEDLAALFRASLAETGVVTVAEERELCERYLRIEQLRLGERLTVHWRWDLPAEVPIPALVLQPLLENAIYHGIQLRPAGGTVEIGARMRRGWAEIEVINPLPDSATVHQGHQLAIDNIRRRLHALFGDGAVLRLTRKADRFVAQLCYRPTRGPQG